ncbi:hypothetical protein D3C80_1608250 [compost metagenome]
MILQLAEAAGEGHVIGPADLLLTQKQHSVPEQEGAELGEQPFIMNGVRQAHAAQFGADMAGQLFYTHVSLPE